MNWPGGAGRRAERAQAEASATDAADESRERARRTGEILRQSRTERGITLSDVEQDIRINRVYLEALENARFEVLPAPVYARGFMRSYARYLGLDPDEALRAVPRDLPRPAELDPLPGLRRSTPPTLPPLPRLSRPAMVGVGVALALVVAAFVLVPRLRGGSGDTSASTPTATSTAAVSFNAPNVVGATREAATSTLESAGLTLLIILQENAATPGTVYRQSPGAGEPVRRGDVVTLFVSQEAEGAATSTATPTATPTAAATATSTLTTTATATPAN